MIKEDFDVLFSSDIFAIKSEIIPINNRGPRHALNVIFDSPFYNAQFDVETNDYTATGRADDFLTAPIRGDELIVNQVSYLIITAELDRVGSTYLLRMEVK